MGEELPGQPWTKFFMSNWTYGFPQRPISATAQKNIPFDEVRTVRHSSLLLPIHMDGTLSDQDLLAA